MVGLAQFTLALLLFPVASSPRCREQTHEQFSAVGMSDSPSLLSNIPSLSGLPVAATAASYGMMPIPEAILHLSTHGALLLSYIHSSMDINMSFQMSLEVKTQRAGVKVGGRWGEWSGTGHGHWLCYLIEEFMLPVTC